MWRTPQQHFHTGSSALCGVLSIGMISALEILVVMLQRILWVTLLFTRRVTINVISEWAGRRENLEILKSDSMMNSG